LRAIENRRWVVRSANTGKSGVFDEFGLIQKETGYWKEAAFQYPIPRLEKLTFYTKHGDYLGVISQFIALFLFIGLGIQFMINKRNAVS
jgi:apolipoprotein N-acyltransferase